MAGKFDLFGDPISPGHGKQGRPSHVPTDENRNKIMLLLALDWSEADIASALAICTATLSKHYLAELSVREDARRRVDATRILMLFEQCQAGNVSAMREFNRAFEAAAFDLAAAQFNEREAKAKAATAKPQGKKQQAQAEFEQADAATHGLAGLAN